MEKKAPLIKVQARHSMRGRRDSERFGEIIEFCLNFGIFWPQAEKRSNELGGGQLPRELPSQLLARNQQHWQSRERGVFQSKL